MNKIIIFGALVCLVSLAHAGYLYQPPVPAIPAPVPAAGVLAPTLLRTASGPLVISNAAPLPYYASPYAYGAAAPVLASSPYAVYGK